MPEIMAAASERPKWTVKSIKNAVFLNLFEKTDNLQTIDDVEVPKWLKGTPC